MKSNEVYLSMKVPAYKTSKAKTLECQINLLNSLRRLHNLRVLARQKHDLKKEYSKLLSQLSAQLLEIQEKIPKPEVPEIIREKKKEKKEVVIKDLEKEKQKKKNLSRRENIEKELQAIKTKLATLNS